MQYPNKRGGTNECKGGKEIKAEPETMYSLTFRLTTNSEKRLVCRNVRE